MRRALTPLILAGAVAMLIVSPVAGHRSKTDSDVFITFAAGGQYKGKVVSPRSACEGGRTVKVFHNSSPVFRIGTTTTKSDGTWELRGPKPPRGDTIFAVVTRRFLRRNSRHRHVCKFDESPDVVYPKN